MRWASWYEGLSNAETAEALGIEGATASKRYGRTSH